MQSSDVKSLSGMETVEELDALDDISAKLPAYAREDYLRLLTAETRCGLVAGLSQTVRWVDDSERVIAKDFKENNLDHVLSLIDWANKIESDYPLLWTEVCDGNIEKWKELMTMLIIHDIGEIVLKDLSRGHTEFHTAKGRRHKRKESLVAGLMIDKYLPGEEAGRIKKLYREFEHKNPDVKLVMLGHILDKGQASQNVARHIIPYNFDNQAADARIEIKESMGLVLGFANNLANNLSSGAKLELKAFLEEQVLKHFEQIEHQEVPTICAEVRKQFPLVMG